MTFDLTKMESDQIKIMQVLQMVGKKIDKHNGNGDHEDPVVLSEKLRISSNPVHRTFFNDSSIAKMYISEYYSLLERLNGPS